MRPLKPVQRVLLATKAHWPLIFFTLLGQAAVGVVLAEKLYGEVSHEYTSLILMGTGLCFSVFHLHYIKNSWRSLSNWIQSPLSQEALVTGIFAASLAAPIALGLFRPSLLAELSRYIVFGQIFTGLLLVVSMARLYMLRTVGVWNRFSTPLAFFATSLLLGTGVVVLMVDAEGPEIWFLVCMGLIMKAAAQLIAGKKHKFVGAMQESRHELPVWCRSGGQVWGSIAALPILFFVNAGAGLFLLFVSELFSRVEFYALHGHDRSVFWPVQPAVSSWRDTLE